MYTKTTFTELIDAAAKINEFAKPFTLKGERGERLHLADVWAAVCDLEGGPLSATDTPVGEPRLSVDIEFFREGARTLTAKGRAELQASEDAACDVERFCKSLGFAVKREHNAGSGDYGSIDSLHLS